MSGNSPTIEQLCAYIDGELPAAERAQVAAAVARDPRLAARIATLSNLKASLAAEIEPAPPLDLRPHALATTAPIAVALSLVAALFVGLFILWFSLPSSSPPTWVAAAIDGHARWIAAPRVDRGDSGAHAVLAAAGALGAAPVIPDLDAAHLRIVGTRLVPNGESKIALQIRYAGERGCRVSLWVAPAAEGPARWEATYTQKDLRAYAWRAGPLDYALVSGMAAKRFADIADIVREATRRHQEPGPTAEALLRKDREESPPCA